MDRIFDARLLQRIQPAPDARVLDATSETLTAEDNSLDVVTCSAAHHFSDNYRFAMEARRVLKVGALLAIQDVLLPEDKRAGEYINSFYQLGHIDFGRGYSESNWRGTFLDADFTVEQVQLTRETLRLVEWAKLGSPYVLERLQILLMQAPPAVREWLKPACIGTADATFEQTYIIIVGQKSRD